MIKDKIAYFSFYEEIKDFLNPAQRQCILNYSFNGNPAVKDAIEAIGIPHTEVNLIFIGEQPVSFDYQLQDQDHVYVYPLFQSCELNATFILDVHLGKLARYLRLLGIDAAYNNSYEDQQIIELALDTGRIILTRDVPLLKNKLVTKGYWVRNTAPKLQVHEVIKRFSLLNAIIPFSRCLHCNSKVHPVSKNQIESELPPMTKIFYNNFTQCSQCHKIYWPGAHFQKLLSLVNEMSKISNSL